MIKGTSTLHRSLSTTDMLSHSNIKRTKQSFPQESISFSDEDSLYYSRDSSPNRSPDPDKNLIRVNSSSDFNHEAHKQIVEDFSLNSVGEMWDDHYHKGELFAVTDQQPETLMKNAYDKSVFSGLKSDARILDVACGAGHFVQKLREMGYRAEGIDATTNHLSDSQHIRYETAIEDTPLPKEHYDAIFSSRGPFTFTNLHIFSSEENEREAKNIRLTGLKNMTDALVQGGKIHLVPVYDQDTLNDIVGEIPELKIVSFHPWTNRMTLLKDSPTKE